MGHQATVRQATLGDAAVLAALSGTLGYPVDERTLAQRLENLLARDGDIVLVAEDAPGRVVGWLHGAEQEILESGRRCEILGLVVSAAYQGRGVGRRLVARLEEWAARRGLDEMSVRSNVVRAGAHPFYERLGFVRVKTQHAYRKRLSGGAAG